MAMLARVLSPFQEFGLPAGVVYCGDRVLQRLSPHLRLQFYELLEQPIPEGPLLPPRLAKSFELREIHAGAPELARMPARTEIKASRFRQNAICLAAFQKEEFVGHIWFCFGSYQEDEVRCNFLLPDAKHSVFDFDLYLFPEHRMGLGFVAIWNAANEFLRSRGIRCSYSRLTRFNLASRRAHLRLGARCIGRMLVLQFGKVEFTVATLPPYVHISFSERDRTQLKLRASVPMRRDARGRLVGQHAG
jgi:hypothetical protein